MRLSFRNKSRGISGRYALLLMVAATLLVAAAAAHAQLFGASEREINRQARLQWNMAKREMPVAIEQNVNDYVACVAHRVLAMLGPEFDDIAWEVVVFEDDSVNAFALPGGKIGVFTGLLRVADNQDKLAAVIGHEVAHVTEDHVIRRARQAGRSDLLTIVGSAATGIHPEYFRMSAMLGLNLPYARDQETEADLVGLQYMARAGFDPRASLALWQGMSRDRNRRESELMSTHPSDDRRMDSLVRSLTSALITYNEALDTVGRANCQLR